MKKILTLFLTFILINFSSAEGKSLQKSIDSAIKESHISRSSIAISIKDLKSGKTAYKLNDQILMHPASIQKILTIVPIMDVLGNDYNFSTKLYSRGNSDYVLELGADPYLSTSDLKSLVKSIDPVTAKKIYIDDTIIETKDWGEGWQWDDDLNISMPRFNSYNLDGNIIKFTVIPTTKGQQAQIRNDGKSNIVLFNKVITDDENNVKISRNNASSNIVILEGTVKSAVAEKIPNNNLKSYFNLRFTNALEDNKIYLKEAYGKSSPNSNDKEIANLTHPINIAVEDVLLNSNNMVSETLGKLAGGKYYKKQGTDIDAIKLFNDYFEKIGLDNSRIRIVDASGVSKNNLVNTDFITEFLIKNQNNETLQKMCTPGTGTLSNRLIPLKNNIKAKTGTLSDISGIAGFLTTKSGKEFAISILINDPSSSSSEKKILEDYLIRNVYLNF